MNNKDNKEYKESKQDFNLLILIVGVSLLLLFLILYTWEGTDKTWIICTESYKNNTDNTRNSDKTDSVVAEKPVINMYNYISDNAVNKNIKANVKLRLQNGVITCTYPKYNSLNGWDVEVSDILDKEAGGTVLNLADNKEYNYIYWEGTSDIKYNPNEGFVIAGDDTAAFLADALEAIGLNRREVNEFIVYWLPKMESNKYNYITFLTEEYTTKAELMIEPKPDNLLRVYMMFKGLSSEDEMEPLAQNLEELKGNFKREGFTVVEWGGTEILSDKIK